MTDGKYSTPLSVVLSSPPSDGGLVSFLSYDKIKMPSYWEGQAGQLVGLGAVSSISGTLPPPTAFSVAPLEHGLVPGGHVK